MTLLAFFILYDHVDLFHSASAEPLSIEAPLTFLVWYNCVEQTEIAARPRAALT